MALVLGIDGGGTRTVCAVADSSHVKGRFAAGTCKINRVGRDLAAESLRVAVNGALHTAGAAPEDVMRCCAGIAGASQPEVVEWVRDVLRSIFAAPVTVVGDNVIAHHAAFADEPGILVVAGTGSIVYGRNQRGESARAGGWGPVVSDEGSGDWIGRRAVSAALNAMESGDSSLLKDHISAEWRVATKAGLLRRIDAGSPSEFSALAPLVVLASENGDATAREILTLAGRELGRLAVLVMDKLFQRNEAVQFAGAGGVLANSTILREALRETVCTANLHAIYPEKIVDPLLGAIAMARREGARPL